jgi:hypothetical protein
VAPALAPLLTAPEAWRRWIAEAGIVPDPRYPSSAQLVYRDALDLSRFWLPRDADLPGFISAALAAASDDGPYWLHPRGGGPFHFTDPSFREEQINAVLSAVHVPGDAEGGIGFTTAQLGPLLLLTTAYFTFGWCVGTDLEIIPDNRSCVLMLGHHSTLAAHFPNQATLDRFVAAMSASGYQLPDHVPDATFKTPPWMRTPGAT